MFYFLGKIIFHGHFRFPIRSLPPAHKFSLLQSPSPFNPRCVSSSSSAAAQSSFMASYLMDTLGFSPESALKASKYLHYDNPDKPNAVIAFLKSHGFSESQIRKIVKRAPLLLQSNPEKTLLPKLEFFYSKGVSKLDLAIIFSGYGSVLTRSLEKQIIPSFNFFREFLESDEKVIKFIKRFAAMITVNLERVVAPNLDVLREIGVPKSNLASILLCEPRLIFSSTKQLKENLEKVKKMGISPSHFSFVLAASILGKLSKSNWVKKVDTYRKWGLSEEEVLAAFSKHPWFMMVSDDKIEAVMDVFVNQLGMDATDIAKGPYVFSMSLRKRIVPRAPVAQILISNGFLRKDFSLITFFGCNEKKFLEKYVFSYKGDALQLFNLYKEKLDLPG
uniref:Uncharacterized protein LOC8278951 n=1 Tax=Rhizophora mucronata TaxID=61149 RepID=A0A2P2NYT3_RHIMU